MSRCIEQDIDTETGAEVQGPACLPSVGLGFAESAGTADVDASPKRWLPNLVWRADKELAVTELRLLAKCAVEVRLVCREASVPCYLP